MIVFHDGSHFSYFEQSYTWDNALLYYQNLIFSS
jgi:hypothetical protein